MQDQPPAQHDTDKQALRLALRARRRSLAPPAGTPPAHDAGVAAAALIREVLSGAGHVALYLAFDHEFDPAPIGALAQVLGATLYYPRVIGGEAGLAFHALPDPAAARRSRFGVLEPAETAPPAPQIDVFLIPGLGFDRGGHRLGYGRGHYDATLRRWPAALRIAPCYPFQLLPAIPHDQHDEPVDLIVTPSAVHRTGARGLAGRYKEV